MSAKVAYILYDSRSGSTLLASLLNRFAGVEVSLESAFTSRLLEYDGPLKAAPDVLRLIEWLRSEVQFRELNIDTMDLLARAGSVGPYTKGRLLTTVLETVFPDTNAEWWIVKHSPYLCASEVCTILPAVRFIHIVRDGRGVFTSKRTSVSVNGMLMQTNLIQAARDWSRKIAVAEALRSRVHTVRFEDLVADTDSELTRIADFLGLSDSARRIVGTQSDYGQEIGESQRHLHTNVFNSPDGSRSERWSDEMNRVDIWCYTWLARRNLSWYGYPTRAPYVPSTPVERARMHLRLARWFAHLGSAKIRNATRRLQRGEGLRAFLRPPRAWTLAKARRNAANATLER